MGHLQIQCREQLLRVDLMSSVLVALRRMRNDVCSCLSPRHRRQNVWICASMKPKHLLNRPFFSLARDDFRLP
eukprot:5839367-Amphidinium_carterae.2